MKKNNLLTGSALNREALKAIKGGIIKGHAGPPPAPKDFGASINVSTSFFDSCYACCWIDDADNCSVAISVPSNSTCVDGAYIRNMACAS